MSLHLLDSVAVVAARNFNVTIMDQLWLVDNHLLKREEFKPGCVFTDMIVQVQAQGFDLLVTPEQLQCRPHGDPEEQQAILQMKLGGIVKELPHTPYVAVGLNFTWRYIPSRENANKIARAFFFVEKSPLHKAFDTANARFGSYLSQDMFGGRLRLQVNPSHGKIDEKPTDFFLLAFNFHRDLVPKKAVESTIDMLSHWKDARRVSEEIAESFSQGDVR